MRERIPQSLQRTTSASNLRRTQMRPRYGINEIIRLILIIWMVSAYVSVFIVYLATKDTSIVLIWTSGAALATITFTYFFRKK